MLGSWGILLALLALHMLVNAGKPWQLLDSNRIDIPFWLTMPCVSCKL